MSCKPQQHTCEWAERAAQVERILTRYVVGISLQALATEHGVAVAEVRAIAQGHGLPERRDGQGREQLGAYRRECRTGSHTCFWADRGDVVDQLVAGYNDGMSLNELSRTIPYFSRATAARILDAHQVPRRSRSEQCIRVQLDIGEIEKALADGEKLTTLAARHKLSRQMLRRRLNQARTAA